jgi:hypothetical protein
MGLHAMTTHARMFFPLLYCSLSPLPVLCAVQLMHYGPALFNPESTERIPTKFSYEVSYTGSSCINWISVHIDPCGSCQLHHLPYHKSQISSVLVSSTGIIQEISISSSRITEDDMHPTLKISVNGNVLHSPHVYYVIPLKWNKTFVCFT